MAINFSSRCLLALLTLQFTICNARNLDTGTAKDPSDDLVITKTSDAESPQGADSDADSRFNLNFNRGHAHAVGPYGQFGASDSATWGFNAGIQQGGRYQSLGNNVGGFSNTFNSGPGSPLTFSNSNINSGFGNIRGGSQSGFHGGAGNALANSVNQNFRIPLGNGAVLLSNLKTNESAEV